MLIFFTADYTYSLENSDLFEIVYKGMQDILLVTALSQNSYRI